MYFSLIHSALPWSNSALVPPTHLPSNFMFPLLLLLSVLIMCTNGMGPSTEAWVIYQQPYFQSKFPFLPSSAIRHKRPWDRVGALGGLAHIQYLQ